MIQDILDEVLDGEPRYTIKENDGTISKDNVDIVMRTPIMQEGTPINRALFRNIQGDLYTQDRYNKLENITYQTWVEDVPTSGNIFPNSVLSNWTEVNEATHWVHTSTGAILTASSSYTSDDDYPIDAFGGGWQSSPSSSSWIQLELPEAKKITKMNIKVTSSSGSERFSRASILGSKDGSTWTTLYTISSYQSVVAEVVLNNADYYKFYKVNVSLTGNYRALVAGWATTEYYGAKTFTDYYSELKLPLSSYEIGKIINIEGVSYNDITSFDSLYLNINNIGSRKINKTIKNGEKYTLVYNGESWDAIESKVVTGSFNGIKSMQTINLGFTPDLVICYNEDNNTTYVGGGSNGDSAYRYIPRILTKAYKTSGTAAYHGGGIVDNGFDYKSDAEATVYYIAIKF